jgi:hypothetical protein
MPFAARRRDVVAAAVVLFVGMLVSIYFVRALRSLDRVASANSALSYSDRRVAGGNSIVIDQRAAFEAEALIPRTATFRVRVGAAAGGSNALTPMYAEGWFQYFLMPRRPADDANWIVCYRCDTSELGVYTVRWRDDEGISILHRR